MSTQKNQSYRDFLQDKITSLETEKTKLDEQIKEVQLAFRLYNEFEKPEDIKKEVTKSKFVFPPDEYSTKLFQTQKVFFALRSIKTGFAPDVAKELLRLEPELGEKRAKELARQQLSYLNKEEIIDFDGFGRKHKYRIKGAA